MKVFAAFVIFILTLHPIFAFAHQNLFLTVNFKYQQRTSNGSFEQHAIRHTLKTTTHNHQWTAIHAKPYNQLNQLLLLTKIEKAGSQDVTMRFLVLDTGMKPNIISAPKLAMRYGQKAELTVDDSDKKIELGVIAVTK
ncbi:hypothetical protein [Aquicella lusitana]|uniref:Uncharacterized protein n=1 Tax=Aquicella lusitana TaxID=254246 RepID=A0A370GA38_9COXI|nr:hypothetical protein [Aquicella lusitana]RDI40060.1 hypothetical protein C8D86_12410 [Aquicella lusitana]VVC72340.1 hypothetical protein AQULUS_00500 [Aquicella lusitana]